MQHRFRAARRSPAAAEARRVGRPKRITVQQDYSEMLIGIAEIAVALSGFTGVVVVFGSRSHGNWHPGDRLRLSFLLESSLTAGGFALLTLVLLQIFPQPTSIPWVTGSILWALFMPGSLYSSHRRISENLQKHGDIDRFSNRLVFVIFALLVVAQVGNVLLWKQFAPLLAALCFNLAGAAMQFSRLILSAFRA